MAILAKAFFDLVGTLGNFLFGILVASSLVCAVLLVSVGYQTFTLAKQSVARHRVDSRIALPPAPQKTA